FLSPDAIILEGAGKGEINEHDLDNIDRNEYGLDRFKADAGNNGGPDPAYPGRFKGEDHDTNYDDDDTAQQRHNHNHYHRHEYDNSGVVHATSSALHLLLLIAIAGLQLV
ncbi:hypothetical protein GGI21_003170, partial [Coemansia aciculifera]